MTLELLYKNYVQRLQKKYELEEANEIVKIIFADNLDMRFSDITTQFTTAIMPEQETLLNTIVERVESGIPLQQAQGFEYFCGQKFMVNKHVLIPRPETEELVTHVKEYIKFNAYKSLIDFGTGSGCIPISIRRYHSGLRCIGVDISQEALDVANKNNAIIKNEAKFELYDILNDNPKWQTNADIFVSNPPYIPYAEKHEMDDVVVLHEPDIALFVPDDEPYIFYEKIAKLAVTHLNPKGLLAFEIHYKAGKDVYDICKAHGFTKIEIVKSIFGQDRFVMAIKD
jgi:release factor glutamine methyltransferase